MVNGTAETQELITVSFLENLQPEAELEADTILGIRNHFGPALEQQMKIMEDWRPQGFQRSS